MSVVQVRIVRVAVFQRRVMMRMGVPFTGRIIWTMRVLMMRVVSMAVFVIQNLVRMLVRMRFGQVQV